MKNYTVSYWWQGENFAFSCQADDDAHAIEQCENAYEGCHCSDVWQDEAIAVQNALMYGRVK